MTQEELKALLENQTAKMKAIEVKIQALLDAIKAGANVSPEVETAANDLAAEISNTEGEVS